MGEQIDALMRKLHDEGEVLQARLAVLTPSAMGHADLRGRPDLALRHILAHLVAAERGHGPAWIHRRGYGRSRRAGRL